MSTDSQSNLETYAIIGTAMAVHRELGYGFLESVYQAALQAELKLRKIPFVKEVELPIFYRKARLPVSFRADLICYDSIIVELKALSATSGKEEAQVINYLKATEYERSLLINFGTSSLDYKRLIFSS